MATGNLINQEVQNRLYPLLMGISANCLTLKKLCIGALDDPGEDITGVAAAVELAAMTGLLADLAMQISDGHEPDFAAITSEWLLPPCAQLPLDRQQAESRPRGNPEQKRNKTMRVYST